MSSKPFGSTTGATVMEESAPSRSLGFHNTLFLEKIPLPPFDPDVGDEAFVMLSQGALPSGRGPKGADKSGVSGKGNEPTGYFVELHE